MAHIERATVNGDPRYRVRWRTTRAGEVKFHKRTFRRRKDAEAFLRDLEPGQNWSAARRTFAEYSEAWLADVVAAGRKARTVENYRGSLRFGLRYFSGVKVGDITTLEAKAFRDWLMSECPTLRTPRSIHGAWHPFRATLAAAVLDGALPANPAIGVRLPTLAGADAMQARYHYLRPEEVANIAAALTNLAPYDLLVIFAANTGLRRGEIAGLDIRHLRLCRSATGWRGEVRVEQARRRVTLSPTSPDGWSVDTPKSGKARTVPLPAWLAERMHDYLSDHPRRTDPGAPLFPGRSRAANTFHAALDWSSPWDAESFYRYHFKRALRVAGLPVGSRGNPGVRFHDLRHTYASMLAAQAVRPEVVAKLMGHANAYITLAIYTHLWPEDLTDAVSDLVEPVASGPAAPPTVVQMRRSG